MTDTYRMLTIRQTGGGRREITLSAEDYDKVQHDRAMLDVVHPLKIVDIDSSGLREVILNRMS